MTKAATAGTEALWRGRVEAWRESGVTAEEFTKGREYAAATLRWWSSRLGRAPATRFVRLVPKASVPAPARELVVEIGGARIVVGPGFDAALLADVVRALAGGAR
jgi:transposase